MTTENTMDTNLNGLGIAFKAFDGFQDKLVGGLIGAAGAGAALYGVGKLMSLPLVPSEGGKLSTDQFLAAKLHPAAPHAARIVVAAAGVPAVAMLAKKYGGVKIPSGAVEGATAVLVLVGAVGLAGVFAPGLLPSLPLAGAQLLVESPSSFAGAALMTEEVGKFGGLGAASGVGYATVMGAGGGAY